MWASNDTESKHASAVLSTTQSAIEFGWTEERQLKAGERVEKKRITTTRIHALHTTFDKDEYSNARPQNRLSNRTQTNVLSLCLPFKSIYVHFICRLVFSSSVCLVVRCVVFYAFPMDSAVRSHRFCFLFLQVFGIGCLHHQPPHKYFSLPIKLSLYLNRVNLQCVVAAFHLFRCCHHHLMCFYFVVPVEFSRKKTQITISFRLFFLVFIWFIKKRRSVSNQTNKEYIFSGMWAKQRWMASHAPFNWLSLIWMFQLTDSCLSLNAF